MVCRCRARYQRNIPVNIKFYKLICIEKRVLEIKLKSDSQNQILRLTFEECIGHSSKMKSLLNNQYSFFYLQMFIKFRLQVCSFGIRPSLQTGI